MHPRFVNETNVGDYVSGTALIASFFAVREPVASAIPLSHFVADPKHCQITGATTLEGSLKTGKYVVPR